jgi:NitT/TauT family transport system ATP-binding protein
MRVRAGFIPLVDAAVLIAAADRGFAADEGIDLELVREVSWSNIRDKLNLGHFEAAHLLAPLAIAESLGLDYAKVPLLAPVVLSQNGNSILLGNETFSALSPFAEGDLDDPAVSGAALKKLIAKRAANGEEKLSFGMTFPFSSHNYLLRFWMGASGIDPDEDVRLVVLPPPYMVDSLKSGHVHGFCVGAPWGSVGVEAGIGRIVHLGTDIIATCPEKVLGVRAAWGEENEAPLNALTRAVIRATAWCANSEHRIELSHLLAAPGRLNVEPDLVVRALQGRLKVDPAGRVRENARYLMVDSALVRPEPRQALWLYAQMARWRQAPFNEAHVAAVKTCFSPATYDAALASMTQRPVLDDDIGAYTGPVFDPADIAAYLAAVK